MPTVTTKIVLIIDPINGIRPMIATIRAGMDRISIRITPKTQKIIRSKNERTTVSMKLSFTKLIEVRAASITPFLSRTIENIVKERKKFITSTTRTALPITKKAMENKARKFCTGYAGETPRESKELNKDFAIRKSNPIANPIIIADGMAEIKGAAAREPFRGGFTINEYAGFIPFRILSQKYIKPPERIPEIGM